ncbi:hypothetical protein HYFRA_00010540 [Hymenoscyphus fraxineus]|uniref:Uncharacterized protein n=1 Tax=Hymenoscyphus fraxineus TaxID=746836 RepID=A0A9N9L9L7_9HELO|nr:hypothetical protein HYFRA_00010540 [Hymenoscyphus fraxineus]
MFSTIVRPLAFGATIERTQPSLAIQLTLSFVFSLEARSIEILLELRSFHINPHGSLSGNYVPHTEGHHHKFDHNSIHCHNSYLSNAYLKSPFRKNMVTLDPYVHKADKVQHDIQAHMDVGNVPPSVLSKSVHKNEVPDNAIVLVAAVLHSRQVVVVE